jgi:hypothetical protein
MGGDLGPRGLYPSKYSLNEDTASVPWWPVGNKDPGDRLREDGDVNLRVE